jgi:dienelactone hydrolase
MKWARGVAIAAVLTGLTACSGSDSVSEGTTLPSTSPSTSSAVPADTSGSSAAPAVDGVEMIPDQVVGDGITTAEVYRPASGDGMPVVVMLHGTGGDRTEFDGLAREVAASGAVVYVPTWPVIAEMPEKEEVSELYRRQAEAVVCALRHARVTARDFGGGPDDLTVLGHSGGATVGARVALVEDPPWPGIDCYPGVPHAPDRFVATGGDFSGEYSYASNFPDEYQPYDVVGLTPTNAVQVRLYQGYNDWNVNAATETTAFDKRLTGLGVDSQAAYLDTGHGDMIDVTEPAGRFMAGQVVELIHRRAGVFDDAVASATMTYEDQQCSYDGPTSLRAGEPVAIELRNPTDVPVYFWMVGFEQGFDVIDSGFFDLPSAPLDHVPAGVETGHEIRVDAGATGLLRWVFVRGDQQWVPHCLPEAGTTDPGAGLMHAAPVVMTMRP